MGDPFDRFWQTLDDHVKADAENFGKIRDYLDRLAVTQAAQGVKINLMFGLMVAGITAQLTYLVSQVLHFIPK